MGKIYESNMRSVCRILGIFLFCFALYCLLGLNISQDHENQMNEDSANLQYFKEFSIQTVDGDTITQEILRQAKLTVLNAWAPWCPSCVEEMPALEELNTAYKDIQVIGVVPDYLQQMKTDETYLSQVEASIASLGVTYPTVLSDEAFTAQVYPTIGGAIPCTWAIDAEGNVLARISGGKTGEQWTALFDQWLEAAGQEDL